MDLAPVVAAIDGYLALDWSKIISMAFVLIATLVALRLLKIAVHGVVRTILERDKEPDREVAQKAKTLSQVVETTGRIIVFTLALLTLLSLAGQDITPLLASAGIAGVAIGFGAQNVIKDWLGGFFILFENQYSVDDVIKVGNYSGLVEKMDLRRTVLRTTDGSVVVIPNGEIRVVTNLTKEWSRVVMDVGVAYEADIDHAMDVLVRTATELAQEEEFAKLIIDAPEMLGVEELGEYQVTIRMLVKTQPLQQWKVARALRARIKKAFDREGISIPYPHQVSITKIQPMEFTEERLVSLASQRVRSE
ncbi:MAG TPA: mechanosensitive ion channel family protein [Chloroflexota bacterium]|nr:mechanosensitive ion channel family protein [Chloroflexota bacterium]